MTDPNGAVDAASPPTRSRKGRALSRRSGATAPFSKNVYAATKSVVSLRN